MRVILLGLIGLMVFAAPVAAGKPNPENPEDNKGALVVLNDNQCGILDADGTPHMVDPGAGVTVHGVETPSGNVNLTCTGPLPEGAAAAPKAVKKWNKATTTEMCAPGGCNCGRSQSFIPSTDDWQIIITKSGRFLLRCHFNANQFAE